MTDDFGIKKILGMQKAPQEKILLFTRKQTMICKAE